MNKENKLCAIYAFVIITLNSFYIGVQLYAHRFRVNFSEITTSSKEYEIIKRVRDVSDNIHSIISGLLFIMFIYCTIKDQHDSDTNSKHLKKYLLVNIGCIVVVGIPLTLINMFFEPVGPMRAALFSSILIIVPALLYYLLSRGYGYLKSKSYSK